MWQGTGGERGVARGARDGDGRDGASPRASHEALDLGDPNAAKEREAYAKLLEEQRAVAAELQATANRMTGYRDLPMGRHDMTVMSDARSVDAFEKLVETKQELLALLQRTKEQDEKMLATMRGAIKRSGR